MAYRYTDVDTRTVYSRSGGIGGNAGKTVKFWADSAGTVPVDVGLYSESTPSIPGATTGTNTLEVRSDQMWPEMWDRVGANPYMWIQVGTASSPGDLYKVFADTDQRIVDLADRIAAVHVKDYGAVGDGVTDDTAAIKAAIAALATAAGLGGGTLLFGDGEYLISDTLLFQKLSVQVVGTGWSNAKSYAGNTGRGTVLTWASGAGNKPMIQVRDSYGFLIEGVRFVGARVATPADIPTAAINFRWVTGDSAGTNSKLWVDRCYIGSWPWTQGSPDTQCTQVGVLFDGDSGNNDEWVISRSSIQNCTVAGIKITGSQSIWGEARDTTISSCPIGVQTASDFSANNLAFDNCDLDWDIQNLSSAFLSRYFSERSKQFARLGSGAQMYVWGGDLNVDDLNLAVPMIDMSGGDATQVLMLDAVEFDAGTAGVIKMGAASNAAYSATEAAWLVVRNCVNLSPLTNLDVALAFNGDRRRVSWDSEFFTFRNHLEGEAGMAVNPYQPEPYGGLVIKPTDSAPMTATTAVASDAHLKVWVVPNAVYVFDAHVIYDSPATADFQGRFIGPSGSTGSWSSEGLASSATTHTGDLRSGVNPIGTLGANHGGAGAGTKVNYRARGVIRTGSTGGYLQFQWSPAISDPGNTTVYADSTLEVRRRG